MTAKVPTRAPRGKFHPQGLTASWVKSQPEETQRFLREQGIEFDSPQSILDPAPTPPPAPPPAPTQAATQARQHKQHHRQGPKLTRAEQRAKLAEEHERRDRERFDREVGKIRAMGAAEDVRPQMCPTKLWEMCWHLMGCQNGYMQRRYLSLERNRALAAAIHDEALNGGRRSWADITARRIATFWLLKGALAKYGKKRLGRFGGVVIGFPRTMFIKALGNPFEPRKAKKYPSESAVFGVHRLGGTTRKGTAGYAHALCKRKWKHAGKRAEPVALRRVTPWAEGEWLGADIAYTQQLPAHMAEPFEALGKSGHALGRTWLPTLDLERVRNDAARFSLMGYADRMVELVAEWTRAKLRSRQPTAPPPTAAA